MALEVSAYAKLNLVLEVLGRRSDGYHEVRTVMQTIDLADKLEIEPASDFRIQCNDHSLTGESNLVWQAAAALAKHSKVQPKAHVRLEKRIPVAMGLGGGSSDAAATLLALNQLWKLRWSTEALAEVAAGLGSDVSFFLWGKTAVASGRGEQILPLTPLPSLPVTLVCPVYDLPGKTPRLYSLLTREHYSDGGRSDRLAENLEAGEFVSDLQYNVFESVAFGAFPGLEALREKVCSITGKRVHLSGSGPTVYILPSSKDEFHRVADALQPEGARVYFVHTIGSQPLAETPG